MINKEIYYFDDKGEIWIKVSGIFSCNDYWGGVENIVIFEGFVFIIFFIGK